MFRVTFIVFTPIIDGFICFDDLDGDHFDLFVLCFDVAVGYGVWSIEAVGVTQESAGGLASGGSSHSGHW